MLGDCAWRQRSQLRHPVWNPRNEDTVGFWMLKRTKNQTSWLFTIYRGWNYYPNFMVDYFINHEIPGTLRPTSFFYGWPSLGWFKLFTWEMGGNHQTSIYKWLALEFQVQIQQLLFEENLLRLSSIPKWVNLIFVKCLELQGQPFINGWKWWFPTISHVKIVNHPIETTIKNWLFRVPGSNYCLKKKTCWGRRKSIIIYGTC